MIFKMLFLNICDKLRPYKLTIFIRYYLIIQKNYVAEYEQQ